jgi:hypothetical protein
MARTSRDLNERPRLRDPPRVAARAMPGPLDLRILAALIAAAVALGTVVAGEPAGLAVAAILIATAMAVSLVWRQ